MTAAIDITGQRFGRLVAIKPVPHPISGKRQWLFQCDCGGQKITYAGLVRFGKNLSCRCAMSRPTHGMHDTRLYRVWGAMKSRCSRPKHVAYARYGGRGITVCAEWQSFEPFCKWALSNGYTDDLEIDRRDNDKGYSPENCRFVTKSQNLNNRSTSRKALFFGEEMSLTEAARRFGVSFGKLTYRLKTGMTPDEAINKG